MSEDRVFVVTMRRVIEQRLALTVRAANRREARERAYEMERALDGASRWYDAQIDLLAILDEDIVPTPD
jgi:hypothetical protein